MHTSTSVRRNRQSQVVFGLTFAPYTLDQTLSTLLTEPAIAPRLLVTCNLDHVVNLRVNAEFQSAYSNAWRVTADGTPVFIYQRLRGGGAPERVTGADLFAQLMVRMSPEIHRPFFITSSDAVGSSLLLSLQARGFKFDSVPFQTPIYGFEADPCASERLIQKILSFQPTHLFLGVGAPKSEIWASASLLRFGSLYVIPVGAAPEFYTGHKHRAPRLIQTIGLEWAWRLVSEPKRLWRRYLLNSWPFILAISTDLSSSRRQI